MRRSYSYFGRAIWPLIAFAFSSSSLNDDRPTTKLTIPSWDELDSRPIASWYDPAKFGIFLHWGAFSVPAVSSEWFWFFWREHYMTDGVEGRFIKATERPGFVYQEYARRFTAEFYNATDWARMFAEAGAQYVVMTSKHHEGYCMWNSSSIPATWNWNVMDMGPHRDVLGELAQAVRSTVSPHTANRIKFGVYHSLYEWYNPLYLQDKATNFTTQHFVNLKTLPELYDLVNQYEVDIVWSDGQWEAHSDYWRAREFLDWYSTQSPVHTSAVWNDRWGTDTLCKHGSFLTCDDRYRPGATMKKKWEECLTVDKKSWGYNRLSKVEDYMTTTELVHELIQVVSNNGNMLLNVGPSSDGTIHPIFVDRLKGLGAWLSINGAGVYDTTMWGVCQKENESIYYTRKASLLYVHLTAWPSNSLFELKCPIGTNRTEARMLGLRQNNVLSAVVHNDFTSGSLAGITIQLPALTPDIIPCQHAWVLELSGIANF